MNHLFFSYLLLFSFCPSVAQKRCEADVNYAGTMREALKNGKTGSALDPDTLNKEGLIGIGPLTSLAGEITVADGKIYVSKVADHKVEVSEAGQAGSPFFVYANVPRWTTIAPHAVNRITDIDSVLCNTGEKIRNDCAFPFIIKGKFTRLKFHVLEGQGEKTLFENENIDGTLIGFFSRNHKGVFTHHDSNIHIHFLSNDKKLMGHVDDVEFLAMNAVWQIPDKVDTGER